MKQLVLEITALRKGAGFSQYRLAKAAGLSREAVRLIENGERSPTIHSLFLLCSALDAKLSPLVEAAERK